MVRKKTLLLLAALAVVSRALLGRYFWIAGLLCALLYVARVGTCARRESGWSSKGLSGDSAGYGPRGSPVVAASWLGICALSAVMALVMAGRGEMPADGLPGEEPEYVAEVREEGVFDNGAGGLRVFARTEADSEAQWRKLASEIDRENGAPDFLWVDILDESTGEPEAVVTVFGTGAAAEALGNDAFGPDGGKNGDGVYVFGPEELRARGYSPDMNVFGTVE